MGSVIAAGTSYATHGAADDPGLRLLLDVRLPAHRRRRCGRWATSSAAASCSAPPPGRTTLTGEGLQHNDGHSLLLASTNPACVAYDAGLGVTSSRYIVKDGAAPDVRPDRRAPGRRGHLLLPDRLQRAVRAAGRARRVPGRQRRARAGILRGLYRYAGRAGQPAADGRRRRRGRGRRSSPPASAMRWALEAQRLLAEDWGVAADVWSATSWTELRRDALACEEWNLLHPDAEPRRCPYVTAGAGRGARPGGRGQRLDARGARPDRPVGARRRSARSAPTGSASPTPGPPPAGSSTWTPSRSRWRVLTQLARRARSSRRRSARPSRSTGSTFRSATPCAPQRFWPARPAGREPRRRRPPSGAARRRAAHRPGHWGRTRCSVVWVPAPKRSRRAVPSSGRQISV